MIYLSLILLNTLSLPFNLQLNSYINIEFLPSQNIEVFECSNPNQARRLNPIDPAQSDVISGQTNSKLIVDGEVLKLYQSMERVRKGPKKSAGGTWQVMRFQNVYWLKYQNSLIKINSSNFKNNIKNIYKDYSSLDSYFQRIRLNYNELPLIIQKMDLIITKM